MIAVCILKCMHLSHAMYVVCVSMYTHTTHTQCTNTYVLQQHAHAYLYTWHINMHIYIHTGTCTYINAMCTGMHTQTQKINNNNKSEIVLCLLKNLSQFVHLLYRKNAILSSQTLCIELCNKLKKYSFY